ncbi:MAG: DMT family transporter [Candidatus Limnocylindrales bacterium]
MDRRSPLAGSLVVIFAGCLFAMLGVLSRWSFDAGLSPFTFVIWRSGVAALAMAVLVLVSLRRGGRLVGWRSLSPRDRVALGVAALMGASLDVTMFLAFSRVSVAIVLLCFYLFPAIVAGASALLGWERLDRVRGVALVVALGGMVAVVVGGPATGVSGGTDLIGVVLALGSALSQAVFVLVARRGYRQVPADQAMVVILTVSTTIATVLALAFGTLSTALLPFASPDLLGLMLFAGVFAAGLPSLLFLAGIRWIGGVRAGILMLAQAPVGVVLAAVFLEEGIGPLQIAGGIAILAAALVIQRSLLSEQPAQTVTQGATWRTRRRASRG